MAKSTNKQVEASGDSVKKKTSLYLMPIPHNKIKYIAIKENSNPNTLFEQAIDDFIERWEKKNGEISI